MSSMSTLRLVIGRELRTRGTSKAYLFGMLAILVVLSAAIVIPSVLDDQTTTVEIGAVGSGNDDVLDLTRQLVIDRAGDDEVEFDVTTYADTDAARAGLADGEVELVLVDGTAILRESSSAFSNDDLEQRVQEAAATLALQDRLDGSGVELAEITSVLSSQPLEVRTVQGVADAAQDEARSLIAYAGMMMLYLAILIFGAWTLQGVTEEKSSRVVEVLLATVEPWQLLAGKVIGIGLLGLAQFGITVAWAMTLIRVTGALNLPVIPVDSAVTLVVWFVLGFALYSTMFATAGALVGRSEDAQSVAFPVSMTAIVGFFVSFQALSEPAGVLARVTTFVPFMSPFVVPIRVAFQEITVWEQLLAVAVTAGLVVVLIRIAARVYAGGALHFAGRLGLRAAWTGARETSRS
ncbi:ABC transporter permease [Euzebya rosea]|uniref:ABC transporter permease n=1 Tax=Euzebya rosea TaxID=2052804 RepID=UPI000D3EA4AB|nr:ABC transporter permease [Euzebya rosea]